MAEDLLESASVTLRRMEKGSYEFVVEKYSLRCEGINADKEIGVNKRIESEEFDVGGFLWSIFLYPAGKTVEVFKSGDVSLYIALTSEVNSPVKFLYELYIIDQSGKGNHQGMNLFNGPLSPQGFSSLKREGLSGHDRFISRSDLESSDYLKDDCLIIRTTIGIVSSRVEKLPLLKVPECNIGADFGRLLDNNRGADVFFKVGGESFHAHKSILAARSPIFCRRFSDAHHQHPQVIDIADVEPRVFEAMLRFIYTGRVSGVEQEANSYFGPSILETFMVKMLSAAHQFELKRLKKICESHVLKKVSKESVVYLLHLAYLYDAAELKAVCLRCIAENESDIMESHGSEYLRETCPSLYLDLIGYKENPSTKGDKEVDLISQILYAVKESVVGMLCPSYLTNMKHIKDL